jgi:hypothetical protein
MKARQLIKEDYPTLAKWWKDNRFPVIPQSSLPNYGTNGLMIYKDGVELCAGFWYDTNSDLAWIEFIVANFEVKDRELRKKSQNFLIENLKSWIKQNNKRGIFTSVKKESLIERLKECDFLESSTNTTEMIIMFTA